jgi:hypothetical protein
VEKQKVLACEHMENDFNIQRPKWLPKLGLKMRELYLQYLHQGQIENLMKIALYNASDTIIESVITKIFLHQSTGACYNSSKYFSPKNKCIHIPEAFKIVEHTTFIKLMTTDFFRI